MQISGVGRLIKDPETKFLDGGKSKTTLSVSVNHQGRKPEGQQYPNSDIYSAEIWGPSGEAAANHLKKGNNVFITGRLECTKGEKGDWKNVKDAKWEFAESRRQEQGDDEGGF